MPKAAAARSKTRSKVDPQVFTALRALLAEHVPPQRVLKDAPAEYYIESPTHSYKGRALFLGAVRTGKAYTSYHLMGVYAAPQLLKTISPALRKRMQGKACFNFTAVDAALFRELKQLTAAAIKGCTAVDWDTEIAKQKAARAKAKR